MNDERKPAKTMALDVTVEATPEAVWKALTEASGLANWFPPEASVDKPGVGGVVNVSWGEGMGWSTTVDAWEPGRHLRWVSDFSFLAPGASVAVDFHIAAEGGRTKVRLVQSGFGNEGGWDELFEGMDTGWRYFLLNLRHYLEDHAGKVRTMISARFAAGGAREAAWKYLLGALAAGSMSGPSTPAPGDRVELSLAEGTALRAVVELVVPRRGISFRIADLGNALLFVELESGDPEFHVGLWLSIYEPGTAGRVEPSVKRRFELIGAGLAKLGG